MTTTKDGYTENPTIHDIRDAELNEKANQSEVAEIRLGYNNEKWSVALEVFGRHRIVYPNGTSEVVNTKSSFCTCGQSRTKPFCDQTHQSFMADPDDTDSEVKWEYLTNKERKAIMDGIKIDQVRVLERDGLRWNNGNPNDPFSKAYHDKKNKE